MNKWLLIVSVVNKVGRAEQLEFVFVAQTSTPASGFDVDDELLAKDFLRRIGVDFIRIEEAKPMP